MNCPVHPAVVLVDDCRACPECYLVALMSEPIRDARHVPMPAYECCGKAIVLSRSDHHKCGKELPQ